jgi:hypothetical protein
MVAPYREEWQGRGEIVHVEWDEEDDYNIDEETIYTASRTGPYFDFKMQEWRCRCDVYVREWRCKHVHYFRRQETIEVNGKYL